MPYNEDGFRYEEACHGKDADRCFARAGRDMETTIARLDAILRNRRIGSRYEVIRAHRDGLVVELHDHRTAGARYDRAYAKAMSDPTGQDLDTFYGDY